MNKEVMKKGKHDIKWVQRNWGCAHSVKGIKLAQYYSPNILLTVSQFKLLFLKLNNYYLWKSLKCYLKQVNPETQWLNTRAFSLPHAVQGI